MVTGNGESGFDSGEAALETATMSKDSSRRENYPLLTLSEVVTRNNKAVLIEVGYWNGYNLDNLTSINERASLVPAAAVIPALVMYRIIVAVKKFVVGLSRRGGSALTGSYSSRHLRLRSSAFGSWSVARITLNGLRAQGRSI
jgi:hypothetical protein